MKDQIERNRYDVYEMTNNRNHIEISEVSSIGNADS